MSGQLQPMHSTGELAVGLPEEYGRTADPGQPAPPNAPGLGRYLQAIKRFRFLVVAFAILGAGAGYAATRFLVPSYEVRATVQLDERSESRQGPIQAEGLLGGSGWKDLLRSFQIADPVVNELGLFVAPREAADSALFNGFRVNQVQLTPGAYVLNLSGSQYTLSTRAGIEVEKGAVGDSIGRRVGFGWAPPAELLQTRPKVEFTVKTPREASLELINTLKMDQAENSPFLFLRLTGSDAERTARTLNAWVEEFVAVATMLKKKRVAMMAMILEGQRESAARALASSEAELENFRVRTVTEPNERPLPSGLELTSSPVFENYFRDKTLADALRRDRSQLETLMRGGSAALTREALSSVALVNSDPAAQRLRELMTEAAQREVTLRRLRESFTDEYQKTKDEIAALAYLQTQAIPGAVNAFVEQLRGREAELGNTIQRSSQDLRGIPQRAIEEQRLKRNVEVSAELYRNLNLKAAEAKLAEASTLPDVNITDLAVAPLRPTKNTAPVLILAGLMGGLALGLGLAVLLDLTDRHFRYPEHVTDELGLFVLGVIPTVESKSKRASASAASQVVEAFRTVRMNVRYAADPSRPLALTITSPGPGDGKSLVASNLALSFAEAGARTLLIDADIRRGALAKTFDVSDRPGLVEYLQGNALIAEVLHPGLTHPNFTLLPAGARRKRAPELLATPRLTQLIEQMTREYDVVIVDSPPLGAGFDAFALATATGNMALVMRGGVTDRKMAAAKLAVVQTLPIHVVGAVLNGIKLTGVYEYYSYYSEYAAMDEPELLPEGRESRQAALPGSRK